jgi:poly-gamma-glutamate synthesis protein (capsule biosynthesis protein)
MLWFKKEFWIFIIIIGILFPVSFLVEEKIVVPNIPKEPEFVNLAFVGDIMLDRGVRHSIVKNFNGDYSALFTNQDLSTIFKNSDIVFGNLEGTASDQGENEHNLYSFRMDPLVLPILKNVGFNILSVANNHIGDWGLSAFIDTLSRLKDQGILYTGGGFDKTEAETPAVIEKNGIKIGFLAFSDKGPNNMLAKQDQAGILLASNPDFDAIVKNAASQVDYLVVSFHFGEEYQTTHNTRQEYLAHKAVDDGAKIVIGAHPHVVEDTETYKNSFIAYSLGNLIFDQSWSASTMQGMMLEIKLNKDGSMTVRKDATQLNSHFQIGKIIQGPEEQINF